MHRQGFLVIAGVGVLVSAFCVNDARAQFSLPNPFELLGKVTSSVLPTTEAKVADDVHQEQHKHKRSNQTTTPGFSFSSFFSNTDNEIELGLDKIQMITYERSEEKGLLERAFVLDETSELMNHVDLQKPFVLYIHGYQEHPTNESIQTVVSAYLKRGTDNIVVLDWSPIAFDNYLIVHLRMKDIAKLAARAITNLVEAGLNVDTLHVIGHSMGAQVAGFIGQYLDFKIPRVTGLDPANPLFYQFGADHVTRSSATQVDIIHTDGGFYGAYPNTGSVDFFPNGGLRPQPGCHLFGVPLSPRGLCSHWRSWRYYAESVVDEKAFPAVKCNSYDDFKAGKCKGNQIVFMGYAIPDNIHGSYFLTTNANSPFGKGKDGVKPNL